MADGPTVTTYLSVDQKRLAAICAQYGVVELSVFGSVGRGEARDDSDLDLLYVLGLGRHLGFSINQIEDDLSVLSRVGSTSCRRRRFTVRSEMTSWPTLECSMQLTREPESPG